MRFRTIEVYLFPLENLRCGYGVQQGNLMPSLPHVPGRVVRGGMAGWAIRTGRVSGPKAEVFQRVFMPQVSAEVRNRFVSFPFCTYKGRQAVPCSLFSGKVGYKDPLEGLLSSRDRLICRYREPRPPGPVDFLRRECWPSDLDTSLKPSSGMIDPVSIAVTPSPPLRVDLRNRHEETTGRVGGEGLYGEEGLPAANMLFPQTHFYSGKLVFEDTQELVDLFSPMLATTEVIPRQASLDTFMNPARLVFLGRRRVPVAVWANTEKTIDTEKDPLPKELCRLLEENLFSWTALSDFIPSNSASTFPLTGEMLKREMALTEVTVEKKRAFSRAGAAHGYDVESGKPHPSRPTLAAGTCGLFEFSETPNHGTVRKIWEISMTGIGQSVRDGFGRFEINWPIHDILQGE